MHRLVLGCTVIPQVSEKPVFADQSIYKLADNNQDVMSEEEFEDEFDFKPSNGLIQR